MGKIKLFIANQFKGKPWTRKIVSSMQEGQQNGQRIR